MYQTLEQFVDLMRREVKRKQLAIFIAFVVISLMVAAVSVLLPKRFSSHAIIHADESNIIRPLMEGTAVATSIKDQANNARQLLFSRNSMETVLGDAGLLIPGMSDLDIERTIREVQQRTRIIPEGQSLIRIEFSDESAITAFQVAQKFAEHLVVESANSKRKESRDAYAFIDKQVREYHSKLTEAELRLKDYRSDNIDGTVTDSFSRISDLRKRLESSRLDLTEANIRLDTLRQQLSGEADVSRGMRKEGAYQNRVAQLQLELDTLRLSFHDSYPDIVQLRNQISELQQAIEEERKARDQRIQHAKQRGEHYVDESIAASPLFQQLRSEQANTETEIATLQARIAETEKLLAEEDQRIRRIHDTEATLAELTRDYEVNRDIYQDLLKRREKARVSMHLDIEERGLTLKIKEPARIALEPDGLRFIHLALLGMPLGVLLPLGTIAGLLQVDPRIRSAAQLESQLGLPVLGELSVPQSAGDRQNEQTLRRKMLLGFIGVLLVYLALGTLKLLQVL